MSKKTYRPMRALILAGALSLAAVSAAQAGGHSTSGDFHSGASAAPNCEGTGRSQKTAGDTGPGSPGDDTSRSHASMESDGYPVLATEGPPSGPGDNNGRSAALVIDIHSMMAGGRGGISGEV